jgi:dipeptidyl aminopeptidase/acylaminoacyl peptidase
MTVPLSSAPPLIPRRALFGNPERTELRLSPDGRFLSFLAPKDGVLNLWVAPVGDLEAATPMTGDTGRGIRLYTWAWTDEHLLYLQDEGGDENWRLFSVHVGTREVRDLTPLAGVQARVVKLSPKHPYELVVGLNDRVPEYHDLYRLDLRSGERTLLLRNDGFESFLVDDDFRVRFGKKPAPDGGYLLLKREGNDWRDEPFVAVTHEDALSTAAVGLDASGDLLYLLDSRGRNTAALVALDAHTGARTVLFEDPRADVGHVLSHPLTRRVQAAAATYTRTRWGVLDEAVRRDLETLQRASSGEVWVHDRTRDDGLWAVSFERDDAPTAYALYDRHAGVVRPLFSTRPALEGAPLSRMHPVVIPARDGLELVSYLTLPSWLAEGMRPKLPLPTVLLVHGGPWSRDTWGFNTWHQWLANRGYAVLSPNFRGSTGFGKAFVNAGNLEWGAKMHDDLLDAVAWAVAEGIADPARVAIMGGSYGGYATLAGLAFSPEVFAAGVDIVGPSNLQTLLSTIPPYWAAMVEEMARRVGDHRTEAGRALLWSRSPLRCAANIRRPLLIGQGANDPRVKQAESDQIVAALQEREVPVIYALYPDEGHGFVRPENALSFYALTEAFLAEHLGGRSEGLGEDLEGSSLEVKAGAAWVEGLKRVS